MPLAGRRSLVRSVRSTTPGGAKDRDESMRTCRDARERGVEGGPGNQGLGETGARDGRRVLWQILFTCLFCFLTSYDYKIIQINLYCVICNIYNIHYNVII